MPSAVPASSRWARLPLAIVLALAALLAPGLTGTAHAAEATLFVHVYDASWGGTFSGAHVEAFDRDPVQSPDAEPVATGTVDQNLSTLALPAGTHWIRVSRAGYRTSVHTKTVQPGPNWLDVWLYEDPSQAGTLAGTVVDQTGAPVDSDRGRIHIHGLDRVNYSTSVRTGPGGTFGPKLVPGRYRVRFEDDHGQYANRWVGGTSAETAQVFTVGASETVTVPTIVATPAPVVSGTLTDAAGTPLRGATVGVYALDKPLQSRYHAVTGKRGTYAIRVVDPGEFKVRFGHANDVYATQWYENAADWDSARTVAVTQDVTLDAALAATPESDAPHRVTGIVKDSAGAPGTGALVFAVQETASSPDDDPRLEVADVAVVGATGRYRLSELDPGDYTLAVVPPENDRKAFDLRWYGDRPSYRAAKRLLVPAEGTIAADPLTIVRNGTLSGRVAVPAGMAPSSVDRGVQLFDEDQEQVDSFEPERDGSFVIDGLRPGVYSVRAQGRRSDEHGMTSALVGQFWRGAYSFQTANHVRITPDGEVTGIDLALGDTIGNLTKPTVSGSGALGTRLTASVGTWQRHAGTEFSYQWTRNGSPIAGATSATHTTTAADLGRSVAVRVTASDRAESLKPTTAVSAGRVVTGSAKVTVSARGAKRSAAVRVSLRLQGVATTSTTGTVRIHDGAKLVKTLRVRSGTGSATVRGLAKGKHTITVRYAGSRSHRATSIRTTVRVR